MFTDYNSLKANEGTVPVSSYNKLVDAVRAQAVRTGPGYNVTTTLGGTTLQIGRNTPFFAPRPFEVTITAAASDDDPTGLTVRVAPGTVNQLLPSDTYETFSIESDGTYYLKANATSDGKTITSVNLTCDTDTPATQTPVPFALPVTVDILLYVITNGRPFRVIGDGSISLAGTEIYKTDKETPADPGQLPYTSWYVWTPVYANNINLP